MTIWIRHKFYYMYMYLIMSSLSKLYDVHVQLCMKTHRKCTCIYSDCCLTPSEQFIRYIMARTSYISMK